LSNPLKLGIWDEKIGSNFGCVLFRRLFTGIRSDPYNSPEGKTIDPHCAPGSSRALAIEIQGLIYAGSY
jgi:hypothetical protein